MSRPDNAIFQHFLESGPRQFVETGSFHGGGIFSALRCGFDHVTSIESVREYHVECAGKFAKAVEGGKLTLLLGDSAELIDGVCRSVDEPILFWLDAHFQGGESEFSAQNCPLSAEITAIVARANQRDVILIDDLRLLQDPEAWRGHDVAIDGELGRLMRAFPEHVAFRLDGHVPRDIFALMPLDLAHGFFLRFPGARPGQQVKSSAATNSRARQPALIIVGGGHNDRIGNFLPLYGRLSRFSANLGRRLSFPFAEQRMAQVFDFVHPLANVSSGEEAAYKRLVRSAEEVLEAETGASPLEYPAGKPHIKDFTMLGLRVIFSRGAVDWLPLVNAGGFAWDGNLLLKDPFPFRFFPWDVNQSVSALTDQIRVKPALEAAARFARQSGAGDKFDFCFHLRQGDYEKWSGGRYWYEMTLVGEILQKVQGVFAKHRRKLSITLVSDGDIPASFVRNHGVTLHRGSMAEDFIRLAVADLVLSNQSTFSQTAAAVGRAFLGMPGNYCSLGTADQALDSVMPAVAYLFKDGVKG